jgi:hypothetical protein
VPSTFKLGGLSDESIAAAMPYLELDTDANVLNYKPDGDAIEEEEPEWQHHAEYYRWDSMGAGYEDNYIDIGLALNAYGNDKLNQFREEQPHREWKGYFEQVEGYGMHYMIEFREKP